MYLYLNLLAARRYLGGESGAHDKESVEDGVGSVHKSASVGAHDRDFTASSFSSLVLI